ncbi:GGDEF domain-containing protein [Myxococcota bacterium]|nr:GGDEF domain-containing protein [Myxococcota bacterium]
MSAAPAVSRPSTRSLADIPPLPATLGPIVRAAADPETTPGQLGDLCGRDPTVAARVLRLANSAAYAPPSPVGSVNKAVSMLGARALSNLALSLAVVDMLPAGEAGERFPSRAFLTHSLRQATIARLLAARRPGAVQPSDAFTAGLCLDIGFLAFRHADAAEAVRAWEAWRRYTPEIAHAWEVERFGTAHDEVGAEMLEAWGIPSKLVEAVRLHHSAHVASGPPMARIAAVSAAIADVLEADERGPALRRAIAVMGAAGLDAEGLAEILPRVGPEVDELAQVFQLEVDSDVRWEAILREASLGLARLNLSYEDLVRQLESALAEQARLAEQLARANLRLATLAVMDPLTGLANRRRLDEALAGRPKGASPPRHVMVLDVDHFKRVNDRYGHDVGDGVLKTVARALESVVPEGCLLARHGGEEFAVVAFDTRLDVPALAERCRAAVEGAAYEDASGPVRVTLSVGVASWNPAFPMQGEALMRRADQALYEAKRQGRNRVKVARN